MAEIFKARLDGIGGFHRTFAIKRILPHLTTNPEFVDMLVDEAKIAGLLSHANIVQILDLGTIDQQYYIAMEYVNGKDLGKLLKRCVDKGITLPVPHAVYVLLEMLKGLEYAHNRQVMRGGRPVPLYIVHRDISPANVLVSFQGEVKLTDFGIAKASVKALETMSGVIKGRYDYMSPEQAQGLDVDQRSDIYSAGVVLYEVLAGRHPFRRPGELATIEAIRQGTYEPPSYVNPDVPYALDLVVEQALRPDPQERFATAGAFKDALDRFFHESGFIFSASTLAAFLKGLFPECEPRPPPSAVVPATRAPRPSRDEPDDVQLDDESSSGKRRPDGLGGADSTLHTVAGLLRGLPDAGQSGAFGPVAGLADESTLIRPAPGVDPKEWSDAATALRHDPTADAAGSLAAPRPSKNRDATRDFRNSPADDRAARASGGGAPRTTASGAPAPRKPTASASASAAPRAAESVEPRVRVVSRTPSHVHLLYLSLAVFAGVLGLGVGVFAGSSTERRPSADPVVVKLDPVLEIHFPANGAITVDGRAVPGISPVTTTLVAGRASTVRLSNPDHAPADALVTLDYNQVRVLDFAYVDLKKKDP